MTYNTSLIRLTYINILLQLKGIDYKNMGDKSAKNFSSYAKL
jgi:hypothetical protein